MPANQNVQQSLNRAEKMALAAGLYLQGKTQIEIAERVDVKQATVSRWFKALQEKWLEEAQTDFNIAKARELARIDNLERTYWDAYDESRQPRTITKEKYVVPPLEGVPSPKPETNGAYHEGDEDGEQKGVLIETEITTAQLGPGDKKWLTGVQWCIDRRIKLLGLDEPRKLQVSWADKLPQGYDPERVKILFGRLLRIALEYARQGGDLDEAKIIESFASSLPPLDTRRSHN